jgi:hypothetical protein
VVDEIGITAVSFYIQENTAQQFASPFRLEIFSKIPSEFRNFATIFENAK